MKLPANPIGVLAQGPWKTSRLVALGAALCVAVASYGLPAQARPTLIGLQSSVDSLVTILCAGDVVNCNTDLAPDLLQKLAGIESDLGDVVNGLCAGDPALCATISQGPQGAQGLVGSQGPIGADGPIGLTGATGDTGADGPIGPVGPAGAAPAELFTSAAELKACIEGAGARHVCMGGADDIDVLAGLSITFPTGASSGGDYIEIRCLGTRFFSSATENPVALIEIDLSDAEHDHELVIDGCAIDGSLDINETLLRIVQDAPTAPGHSGQNVGRLTVRNSHFGQNSTRHATETAIEFDGAFLDQLVINDNHIEAAGTLVKISSPGDQPIRKDFRNNLFQGDVSTVFACLSEARTVPADATHWGDYLDVSGSQFRACEGIVSNSLSLYAIGTKLALIGSSSRDDPFFEFDGVQATIDASILDHTAAETSGSFFEFGPALRSARVVLNDLGCNWATSADSPNFIEAAVGVTSAPIQLTGELHVGTAYTSCGLTPLGAVLAPLVAGEPSFYGLIQYLGTTASY